MSQTHILKCVNPYFKQVVYGAKTFEVRFNDRGYQVGDILVLREYDKDLDSYSGEVQEVEVIHMVDCIHHFNLNGNVIMSIRNLRWYLESDSQIPGCRVRKMEKSS